MDIFVEQLVKKKRTAGSYARIWGGIIGALLFLWVFFTLLYSFTIIKTLKIIVANVMRITIKWLIS